MRSRTSSHREDNEDNEERVKEKPRVVNKNQRYLDRNEKRHSRQAHDDGSRRREGRDRDYHSRDRRRKQNHFEEDDPWAEKPKVKKYLPPPELTRNKYITDDLEHHFSNSKPKTKVPAFFANISNSAQDVQKMKSNVINHIADHKMKRGHIQNISHKNSTTKIETPIVDKIDSELSELLGGEDIELSQNSKRFEIIDSIANLEDNALFDEIENEEIDLSQINLSPEENRSRLQTFYFSTLPEYIEECLLNILKNQDSMTDSEYYKYLNMERLYITSAKLSEDYRTITLNYRLLVREGIDEMGEEANQRDAQIIDKLFATQFVKPTLETFENMHGRVMLRDFEKPKTIKLNFKGIKLHEPSIFDEPLPNVKPGERRPHINPFAELPYFTGKPMSGERAINILNNLGISIPDDSEAEKKNSDKPTTTRKQRETK